MAPIALYIYVCVCVCVLNSSTCNYLKEALTSKISKYELTVIGAHRVKIHATHLNQDNEISLIKQDNKAYMDYKIISCCKQYFTRYGRGKI